MTAVEHSELEYAGFWIRVLASVIDSVLLVLVTTPILWAVYGKQYFMSTAWVQGPVDFLLSWVFPIVAVILFWIYRAATPGKMMLGCKIVDACRGGRLSTKQCIGRYFGYYLSLLPLGLGFLWIAFDPKKQGWHDKLAGTVVVRQKYRQQAVSFEHEA